MLRKFSAFFCVAALSVAFVGCEAKTEAPAPVTPAASEETMDADPAEATEPAAEEPAVEAPAE